MSIQYKMPPEEMQKQYVMVEEPIQNWDEFFDKYCEGRRRETGIISRYVGYLCESTFFWKEEEEYPFGFVFPNGPLEKQSHTYYVRVI